MKAQDQDYVGIFNRKIDAFFRRALHIVRKDPRMALFLYRTLRQQSRAARTRQRWAERGVHVPPFVITSITRRCNLRCQGCYALAQHRPEDEMSTGKLRQVVAEAHDLGVSIMLIAGGEPLTRPEILDITRDYPDIVFPLFTNGMLIDDAIVANFKGQRHVVPVISVEGHELETDGRRGKGVHARVLRAMQTLRSAGLTFGTSLTLTSRNFATAMDEGFIREMIDLGCRLFFFVDYVPVQEGTEALLLTDEQRAEAIRMREKLEKAVPALFVALPGDEEEYGGCLAAGRGFVHISPEGWLEPCPFSPFADANLKETSLKEALGSRLLATIRANAHELTETKGGCALWARREWVESLRRPEAARATL